MPHVISDIDWPDRVAAPSQSESQYDQYGDGQTWEFVCPDDSPNLPVLQISLLRHAKIRGWRVRTAMAVDPAGRKVLRFQRQPVSPCVVELWAPFDVYIQVPHGDRVLLSEHRSHNMHVSATSARFASGDCTGVFPRKAGEQLQRLSEQAQRYLMVGPSGQHLFDGCLKNAATLIVESAEAELGEYPAYLRGMLTTSVWRWLAEKMPVIHGQGPSPAVLVPATDRVLTDAATGLKHLVSVDGMREQPQEPGYLFSGRGGL